MTLLEFRNELLTFFAENHIPAEIIIDPELKIELIKSGEDTYYHLNTLKPNAGFENQKYADIFQERGKTLVQIWEDQWKSQQEILKARMKVVSGKARRIYGRETEVVKITNPQLLKFLSENHLSVPIKGKIKLGLQHTGKLVSVLSLSHPRTFEQNGQKYKSYEILRFCHLRDYVIVGGLSKLIKHFAREYKPGHIMTYIDREWGNGEGFKKAGFKSVGLLNKRIFLVNIHESTRSHLTQDLENNKIDQIDFFQVYNAGSLKMECSFKPQIS